MQRAALELIFSQGLPSQTPVRARRRFYFDLGGIKVPAGPFRAILARVGAPETGFEANSDVHRDSDWPPSTLE